MIQLGVTKVSLALELRAERRSMSIRGVATLTQLLSRLVSLRNPSQRLRKKRQKSWPSIVRSGSRSSDLLARLSSAFDVTAEYDRVWVLHLYQKSETCSPAATAVPRRMHSITMMRI